jgi:hypothetical protein
MLVFVETTHAAIVQTQSHEDAMQTMRDGLKGAVVSFVNCELMKIVHAIKLHGVNHEQPYNPYEI